MENCNIVENKIKKYFAEENSERIRTLKKDFGMSEDVIYLSSLVQHIARDLYPNLPIGIQNDPLIDLVYDKESIKKSFDVEKKLVEQIQKTVIGNRLGVLEDFGIININQSRIDSYYKSFLFKITSRFFS